MYLASHSSSISIHEAPGDLSSSRCFQYHDDRCRAAVFHSSSLLYRSLYALVSFTLVSSHTRGPWGSLVFKVFSLSHEAPLALSSFCPAHRNAWDLSAFKILSLAENRWLKRCLFFCLSSRLFRTPLQNDSLVSPFCLLSFVPSTYCSFPSVFIFFPLSFRFLVPYLSISLSNTF